MQHAQPDIPDEVRAAIRDLRAISGAELVYLFGSRARGDHHEDSDWDLALILPDGAARRDVQRSRYLSVHADAGIEVHPIRRFIYESKKDRPGTLSRSIAEEGVLIVD